MNDGNGGANYAVTFANNLTGVITAQAITVTAVADTKPYDGGTSSGGVPMIAPALVAGDTAGFTQAFTNRNAGVAKTLLPAGAVNDGNGGANYAVSFANNLTGVITAQAITVTAVNATKFYDGTTSATGTPTLSLTLIPGDTTTVLAQAYQNAAVGIGNKVIIPSITINDGNGGANYAVTPVNFLAGTIKAAETVADWRSTYFTPEEITAGLAADGADADGDGISNLDEYLLGTDPHAATPPILTMTLVGNNCTLSFLARSATGPGYGGLTRKYDLVASSDITTPNSWADMVGSTNIVGDDQTHSVTLPLAPPSKFYRLKVRLE